MVLFFLLSDLFLKCSLRQFPSLDNMILHLSLFQSTILIYCERFGYCIDSRFSMAEHILIKLTVFMLWRDVWFHPAIFNKETAGSLFFLLVTR